MPLTLTPDMLVAAYDFLRTTEPFDKWGMLHGDEVEFAVIRNADYLGFFSASLAPGRDLKMVPKIEVSDRCCGHTDTLLRAVAHEMIHLHQWFKGLDNRSKHNADFKKKAKKVCEAHGWDPKLFV